MSKTSIVIERLKEVSEGTAVAIKIGEINYADNFLSVMEAILKNYTVEKNLKPIYLSITTPASILMKIFEAFGIDVNNIIFVDVISNMMMSGNKDLLQNVIYVESPTMLEYIMLKVRYIIRKNPNVKLFVIIDSVNSLAIHNNYNIMIEFIHMLVNNLKGMGVYTALIAIDSGENVEQINNMLNLVCEETINVREG
jgi:KaiC/GvpD/RAD55 family RecA-like ATPase